MTEMGSLEFASLSPANNIRQRVRYSMVRSVRQFTLDAANLPFTQWASALAVDQTLTAALLDRLLHHAHIVQISGGESCRLKDKGNAGAVKGASKNQ